MTTASPRRASTWLEEIATEVGPALAVRAQTIRLDAEASLWLAVDASTSRELCDLVRLAAQAAPAEGELLLAASAGGARPRAIGEGEVVLRWQLGLDPAGGAAPGVRPLRPAPRSVRAFLASAAVEERVASCAARSISLELEPVGTGDEVLARLRLPSA